MRLKLIASVPLLVLVACGTPSKTRVGAAPEAPLQAALLPPTHGLGFWVNQSAYVAVFDITPGSGIGLLYPNFGRDLERPVSAGPRWAAVSPAYRANQAFFERPGAGSGMRYLFLIASRAPLNIDNTVGYADYLRTKMGPVAFTGGAFASMKTLISEVVPEQPEGDWTTAMYIVPGTVGGRRGGAIYQLVRCEDGRA